VNRPTDRAEIAVAAAAIALGVFVLAGSASISLGAGYDRIGPRFFPYVVGAGLVLSGAFLGLGAWRGSTPEPSHPHDETSGRAALTVTLALVASVLLLERAGFILTSALLFWLVARAFQSRRPWRDAVVGALLSVFVYVAFTRGLGLVLPRGLLDGVL
jgi:putative tricarboxylic transport membrane protein